MPRPRRAEPPLYRALDSLFAHATRPAPHPSDKAVHELRKDTKQIRAALRLLRACLGEVAYRHCNDRVRDAAKPLAPVRDVAVLLSTARHLPLHKCSDIERGYLRELIPGLELERRVAKRRLTATVLSKRATLLEEVQWYLASRRPPSCDLAALGDGIRKTYAASRKAWRRARRRPDDDHLHEWRKQVKYLANQLDLLQEVCHIDSGKIRRHALRLGDHLGRDRDVAILTAKMDNAHLADGDPAAETGFTQLKHRLRKERERFQRKAWRRSKKLFARSPRQFLQHLMRP